MTYVKCKVLNNNHLPKCRVKVGDVIHLPEQKAVLLLQLGEIEMLSDEKNIYFDSEIILKEEEENKKSKKIKK